MNLARFLVKVEQTVSGRTYREQSVAYSVECGQKTANLCTRMDISLYRKSGVVLPGRTWSVEQLEF